MPFKTGFFQEVIKDMKDGVFDYTVDGRCSGCGACCSDFIPISDLEIKTIKAYIRKHGIKEQMHFVPTATPMMDFTCPFRNNATRKCEIYAVRPAICRDFRCDKSKKDIQEDKTMYHNKYRVVSMREEFFK